jgi:hypothetical protein
MAFHVFNISVDMPDAQPDYLPEDLTINDMESVIEIVLEKCLGIENAVVERDETGDESETIQLLKEFQLCCTTFPELQFSNPVIVLALTNGYQERGYFQYFKEINPPPPKA